MGRIKTAILINGAIVIVFIGLTLLMMVTSDPGKFPGWYDFALLLLLAGLILPLPIALLMNLRDWWNQRKEAKSILPPKT